MMNKIYKLTEKLRNKINEKGQGMVEYAVVLGAVALIAAAVLWGVGDAAKDTGKENLQDSVKSAFDNAAKNVSTAQSGKTTEVVPKEE